MWTGLLWFALLAAAGLCYPRRPRLSGTLWIMIGALSVAMNVQRTAGSWHGPISGLFIIGVQRNGNSWLGAISGLLMIGIGAWYLIKYRHPDVRTKHVEYWTAKA